VTPELEQPSDPDVEPIGDDGSGVHNTASGVAGALMQAGVVHGDVHLHPPLPVSVVPRQLPAAPGRRGKWHWIVPAVAVVVGMGGVVAAIVSSREGGVPDQRPTGPDLVINGSFDDLGGQPADGDVLPRWWTHNAAVRPGGGLAQISVPGGTKHAWDVMFGQSGITVTKDKSYVLRFTVWTDKAARIAVRVQAEEPPQAHALHRDIAVDPAQKQVDLPFTAEHTTGSTGQVVFQLGGNDEDYTIYLDDVVLAEQMG